MYKFISTPVFLALALAPMAGAATPQLVSISPTFGDGLSQTFTLTASDSAGAADIQSVDLIINDSFTASGGCWIAYDRTAGLSIANNTGTWGAGANSQCNPHLVSATESGNDWSVSINISFDPNWSGGRNIWAAATDAAGNSSGYREIGSWSVDSPPQPAPDFIVSITPMSTVTQPGRHTAFKITATGINGFFGAVTFNTTTNPLPPGLTVQDTKSDGSFGHTFYVPPTGSGTAGIVILASEDVTPINNIVLTNTFTSGTLEHTVRTQLSILTPAAPVVALSPTSGSASTQTFVITATDRGAGFGSVGGVNFLLNSSFSGKNGCWLFYQPTQAQGEQPEGILSLASDDTTNWSQKTQISSSSTTAATIHNSQCSVFGGTTTVEGSGDTLTLTVTLTFTSAFAGPKQTYVRANDVLGPDSTYQQLGDFTATGTSATPDFSVGVSPGSQNITGETEANYSVTVTGVNGYAGPVSISVTGLPPDATLTPPGSIEPGQSTVFGVKPAATTPPGSYTLTVTGTDGTLTRTATAVLNIMTSDLPYLSLIPRSGSGTAKDFSFLAAKQSGSFTPTFLDVLINSSVDGQYACWMYFDGATLQLASNDGAAWQSFGTNESIHNSQCTLSSFRTVDQPNGVRFDVTITFGDSFRGDKNIYMYTADGQGHETGYQYQGIWTVP